MHDRRAGRAGEDDDFAGSRHRAGRRTHAGRRATRPRPSRRRCCKPPTVSRSTSSCARTVCASTANKNAPRTNPADAIDGFDRTRFRRLTIASIRTDCVLYGKFNPLKKTMRSNGPANLTAHDDVRVSDMYYQVTITSPQRCMIPSGRRRRSPGYSGRASTLQTELNASLMYPATPLPVATPSPRTGRRTRQTGTSIFVS